MKIHIPFACVSHVKRYSLIVLLTVTSALHANNSTNNNSKSNEENRVFTILPSEQTLHYPENVRLSQALLDAYALLNSTGPNNTGHSVYPLASGLIDPNKLDTVHALQQSIVTQLMNLQRSDAEQLATQLTKLNVAYFEPVITDVDKVRGGEKLDPMLKADYTLFLPSRPHFVSVMSASSIGNASTKSRKLDFQANEDLTWYLKQVSSHTHNKSVWVIQPDRKVYLADSALKRNQKLFLAPGAMVFLGLLNLPDAQQNLNLKVAQLLALRLEP